MASSGRQRDPQQGDMVIRALVRARLLGMQLLTLEARVVVGTENGRRPIITSLVHSANDPGDQGRQPPTTGLVSSGSGTGFARAIELLDQGAETLDRIRRATETNLPGLLAGWWPTGVSLVSAWQRA